MDERRVIIRAFLASPSDLQEERLAVKAVVDEVNELWANEQGYHFDLIGWEDTVSQIGRPQEIINKELERCEIFIGMLWKHWGTRPADEGPYTSGFHEEFCLSLDRYRATGFPKMSLFFKKIDPALLSDPGPELRRVIQFRTDIIRDRPMLFHDVINKSELERRVRKLLSLYISTKIHESESTSEVEKSREIGGGTDGVHVSHVPNSTEGLISAFLGRLADAANSALGFSGLTAEEIARFRLLSTSVSLGANDDISMGVHDANLLYLHRENLRLSEREERALFNAGLRSYRSETVPLWHWLRRIKHGPNALVWAATFSEVPDAQVGALTAMYVIGTRIFYNESFDRSFFVEKWLESKASGVKIAALRYLRAHGLVEDIEAIENELAGNDFSTKTASVEALIGISLRNHPVDAARVAIQNSFDNLDSSLLQGVLPHLASLDRDDLTRGVGHSNAMIRTRCIELLLGDDDGGDFIAILLKDERPSVQLEGYKALLARGETIPLEDVKRSMIKPRASAFGTFSLFGTSTIGDDEFSIYRELFYTRMARDELARILGEYPLDETAAFKALYTTHFRDMGGELRRDLGDRYQSWFADLISHYQRKFGAPGSDLVEKTKKLEKHLRTERIQTAAELLCLNGGAGDLELVRDIAGDGYFPAAETLSTYMGKFGSFNDIPLIVKAVTSSSGGGLLNPNKDDAEMKFAAPAIVKLARGRLPELLSTEMPSRLKAEVIERCTAVEFRKLSDSAIDALLRDENDEVRKSSVLRILDAHPKRRVESLLVEYTKGQTYYYNVVHWLDFGASMPLDMVRKGISRVRGIKS